MTALFFTARTPAHPPLSPPQVRMLPLILPLFWWRGALWRAALAHPAWTGSWVFVGTAAAAVTAPVVAYFLRRDWARSGRGKVFPRTHPPRGEIARLLALEAACIAGANLAGWRWAAPRLPPLPLPPAPPSASALAAEMAACLLAGDALLWLYHYGVHRVRCLRRTVHATHHSYKHPYVLGGIYTHPVENMIAAALQLVWPALVPTHPYSWWCAFLVWTVVQLEEHSGYDVWWSGAYWLPGGIGARIHSVHHIDGTKNYGFVFTLWDRLAGTYASPETALPRHCA